MVNVTLDILEMIALTDSRVDLGEVIIFCDVLKFRSIMLRTPPLLCFGVVRKIYICIGNSIVINIIL